MNFYRKPFYCLCALIFCVCIFFSCSPVRDFQAYKPFVFQNKINLQGNLSKDEKNSLLTNLPNYWDDSLFARREQRFFFFYRLKNPPVFDSANISRSIGFMKGYLKSQGYYSSALSADTSIEYHENQQRVTVTMNVAPGKTTIIDSLAFDIQNNKLQKIALANSKATLIAPKKSVFTKQLIASELDRLVALYRQKGFYLLTRDNLVAEVDTTDIALMQLTTDPAELAQKIAEAAERRKQNPTCIVVIKQREKTDSVITTDTSQLIQYHVGNIYYYPEMKATDFPDFVMLHTNALKADSEKNHTMFYIQGLFKFKPLREHTFIHPGNMYNENNYFKTINNLNQMGAWRQVDTRDSIRKDTVDFHFFLYPYKKQTVNYGLEASRNSGNFLGSNNLFGLAFNVGYINRNVWKRSIQSSTVLSNGVELSFDPNTTLLQTLQSSLSHSYSFPKFIAPFKIKKEGKLDAIKTQLDLNAAYTDRKDFFRLRSFVAGWAYQWRKKNNVFEFKIPNIELYSLDTLALLDSAFNENPFLRTSFNTGSVVSLQFSYSKTFQDRHNPNATNYIRAAAEESGAILGRIKSFRDNIYQYIKVEGEYRRLLQLRKNALAFRAMAGIGYNYGNSPRFGNTLPFFKQFVAGGPNSMRAWNLRQIGLGSSLQSDTSSTFRDRYGDMQLEANVEYRFLLATIGGVNIGSALFTDIGNIWDIHKDPLNPQAAFSFNNLGKDIAVDAGTGLRLDFSYFLIRLDFGIKLKDPAMLENNGWNIKNFTWRNKEFAITDASGNIIKRNNYAFQLGIGMPF